MQILYHSLTAAALTYTVTTWGVIVVQLIKLYKGVCNKGETNQEEQV